MVRDYERVNRVKSLVLLAALLLYAGGAVLDPFVHAAERAAASVVADVEACAVGPAVGPAQAPAGPAFEHDCVACKLSRAHALPVAGWTVAWATAAVRASAHLNVAAHRTPPAFASLQPRAPPHI